MSVIADFGVPAEAFCLGETLVAVPSATVELDRVIAHSPHYVMPFGWVHGTDREPFDAAVAEDPTVDGAEVADPFEDAYLYQFEWADDVAERLHAILDHEGVMIEARGSDDEWWIRTRFGSRDHFDAFQNHFEQFGQVTLLQLGSPQTPGSGQYGVTVKQREALLAAYDGGYYEIPSETTGEGLAETLGISQQSFSRRVKRGTAALIENTLNRHRDG